VANGFLNLYRWLLTFFTCPVGKPQEYRFWYLWQTGWTALHFAAESGHTAAVELLLRNGAETEAKDKVGIDSGGWMEVYIRVVLTRNVHRIAFV